MSGSTTGEARTQRRLWMKRRCGAKRTELRVVAAAGPDSLGLLERRLHVPSPC